MTYSTVENQSQSQMEVTNIICGGLFSLVAIITPFLFAVNFFYYLYQLTNIENSYDKYDLTMFFSISMIILFVGISLDAILISIIKRILNRRDETNLNEFIIPVYVHLSVHIKCLVSKVLIINGTTMLYIALYNIVSDSLYIFYAFQLIYPISSVTLIMIVFMKYTLFDSNKQYISLQIQSDV